MAQSEKGGGGAVHEMPFIENLNAPEVFATWVTGFSLNSGNVHLVLESVRTNHDLNSRHRVVIARLVIPVSAAQGLAAGLYDFLKNNGLDPVPKPPSEPLQ